MTRRDDTDVRTSGNGAAAPSQVRLILLVWEGYAYLVLVIGLLVAPVVLLVWGLANRRPLVAVAATLIGIPIAITAARVVRALFFAFPHPEGIVVGRRRCGGMHAMVEDIRRRLGAPRVHALLLTANCNASAHQTPRAGIFWPRNTLLVGYPLLATLSTEQIRAVIAHELGHMTHAHGRVFSWVHRTRLSWVRLMAALHECGGIPPHVYRLFWWYAARLRAQAAAVSRRQELLADALAARVVGPAVAAQALIATAIVGHLLDRSFWPAVWDRVQREPEPPNPFAELGSEIWAGITPDDLLALLDELRQWDRSPDDTHPSLQERLAGLAQPPRLPDVVTTTAADEALGNEKLEVAARLDRQWQAEWGATWRDRHEEIRDRRERLARLAAVDSPTTAEIFEYATLTEDEGDCERALALYRSALGGGHVRAGAEAGRILLDRDAAAGIALIEAAMAADEALVHEGCRLIIDYLERRGRSVDAHRFKLLQTRHATQSRLATRERAEVTVVDRFTACRDPGIDIPALVQRLSLNRAVACAFLVTKELRHSNGTQRVLALQGERLEPESLSQQLRRDGIVPEHCLIAILHRHDQQLQAALENTVGALIYQRRG